MEMFCLVQIQNTSHKTHKKIIAFWMDRWGWLAYTCLFFYLISERRFCVCLLDNFPQTINSQQNDRMVKPRPFKQVSFLFLTSNTASSYSTILQKIIDYMVVQLQYNDNATHHQIYHQGRGHLVGLYYWTLDESCI